LHHLSVWLWELLEHRVKLFDSKDERPQDVLVVLSTSGKSENVRRALIEAKSHGVITIALLGRGGGNCAGIADFELLTPGVTTARIQELQQVLIHSLCEMVEDSLEVSRGNESQ
jgi:D-arabinose 5-phosphate isomerase GutQ